MIYLILAIISSSAISVLMRLSNEHVKNNMVMFAANYIVCGLLSLLFLLIDGGPAALSVDSAAVGAKDMSFAVILGLISGVMYLTSFMLLQFNIRLNGMVLAATFMKLGVLVPILMSVILGWDEPTLLQIAGCVLAVAAIIIINGEKTDDGEKADANSGNTGGSAEKSSGRRSASIAGMWLIILLLGGGFTDSLSNIYDKLGAPALKNQYLLFIFIAATICSIFFALVRKQHFTWPDFLWGALIGVPNYFSARFLLYALSAVPAIVAYPVYNITVILIISTLGFLLFAEKLSRRKLLGMAIIIAAILVLNL